jgi:hypothetical protein
VESAVNGVQVERSIVALEHTRKRYVRQLQFTLADGVKANEVVLADVVEDAVLADEFLKDVNKEPITFIHFNQSYSTN